MSHTEDDEDDGNEETPKKSSSTALKVATGVIGTIGVIGAGLKILSGSKKK